MSEGKKIKLVAIDDNTDDCNLFKEFFHSCPEIELCAIESNSFEGLKKVRECSPDIVLTDLIMPDIDGSEVIKRIRDSLFKKPKIIVLSGVNDVTIINEALEGGADYYLLKPVSLLFLKEKIVSIFNRNSKNNTNNINVNTCMRDIGLPIGLSGYDYAIDAVNIILENNRGMMLKEINNIIAKKNYTSAQCVDACLHNAILKAHALHNEKYKNLFGDIKKCPSNYVFLRTIREYIKGN